MTQEYDAPYLADGVTKRLSQRLALRQAIESRALRRKLANERKVIQKTPHPGT